MVVGFSAAFGLGGLAGGSGAFALEVSGVAFGVAELVVGVVEFFGEALDGGFEVGFEVFVGVEFGFGLEA